jgi:predicted transcriptional regulator
MEAIPSLKNKLFSSGYYVILHMNGGNVKTNSTVSRSTGLTYSHVSVLTNIFKKSGLLACEKTGRKKILRLTTKGKAIRDSVIAIEENLK